MIAAIVGKELREWRRDGRARLLAGLIALLLLVGLASGASTLADRRRQVDQAAHLDRAAFLAQGPKAPHAAAHFGRVAHKPVPPLAVFDPGVAPFLGQVIWLEAHTRNPAMFRPAEDAPELRRLWDLSAAGVLGLLVPLVAFVVGAGAFAAERERGTLRQVVGAGVPVARLFAGKLVAVAGIGVAVSAVTVLVSITLAGVAVDTLVRGAGLLAGYGCYAVACAAVAIGVSARSRTAGSALLVLLGIWAVAVVILPRLAAGAAERVHPTPAAGDFWAGADRALRAARPARESEAYRSAERQVLGRALGREITAAEAASIEVNRVGLGMAVSELVGGRAYASAYRDLSATSAAQKRARRLFSVLSPTIALQHLSSALAGTDVGAHQHFAAAAERHRDLVIRAMNEEMMLRGAGQGTAYLAGPDFWATIPEFTYHPPPAWFAVSTAAWDLLVLAAWSLVALIVARRAAGRQELL